MAKSDIASAFSRILLRPDSIPIFTTEIPRSELGRTSDLFPGNLAIPFGRVSIPAYVKLHTDAVTALRNYCKPLEGLIGESERIHSSIYADDCAIVEFPVGNNLCERSARRGWRCRKERAC